MPAHDWLEDTKQLKSRFLFVQKLTDSYWDVWTSVYFPSLLVRQKWHVETRNMRIGDICILSDKNALRGEWRLAKVADIYPDAKGRVRNVEVMVCSTDGKPKYKPKCPQLLKRHVSNLMVIVPVEDTEV